MLYLQECDETVVAEGVSIAADGSFGVSRPLTSGGAGTWSVRGRFEHRDHAHGSYELSKSGCATGVRPFDAHRRGAGHDRGAHRVLGNPGEYPELARARPAAVRRGRKLRIATLRGSRRLDTLREARQAGYVFSAQTRRLGCPGMHHMRKHGVRFWGRLLDPRAPQALVFWCSSRDVYTLAAYMYRAPADSTPPTFGDLMQWHRHSDAGNWMTHVWIVPDTRAALASCAPFAAFARFGRLRYAAVPQGRAHRPPLHRHVALTSRIPVAACRSTAVEGTVATGSGVIAAAWSGLWIRGQHKWRRRASVRLGRVAVARRRSRLTAV